MVKNEKNIFKIYWPKKATIKKADTFSIDTELSIKLPKNSSAFVATKFEGQEILKIIGPTNTKKKLWITLLNESYLFKYKINKGDVIGYLIIEPKNIKTHYEAKEKPLTQKKRWGTDQWKNISRIITLSCHKQNFSCQDRASITFISMSDYRIQKQSIITVK